MKNGKSNQASITVFVSLSLLLVTSFLFVLLEAARVHGLSAYAKMVRMQSVESLFSNYNRHIFDTYGIFMLDGGFGMGQIDFTGINGILQDYSQNNLRPVPSGFGVKRSVNAYRMDALDCTMEYYRLITDDDGLVFRRTIARRQKERLPISVAEGLQGLYQQTGRVKARGEANQSAASQATDYIEQAKREREEQRRAASAQAEQASENGDENKDQMAAEGPDEPQIENPIELMKELRQKDLLDLVLPSGKNVSAKAIASEEMLLNRTLLSGNMEKLQAGDWYENILFLQYLNEHFDCFTTAVDNEEHALDLEKEYLLCGKASDRENLKAVAAQLLLIREGANFLYLQTDAVKQEEAYSIATALLAATGLVGLAPAVAQGILAAWAFAESILDIRALLNGKKIAWMKTSTDWTSDLSALSQLAGNRVEAKSCANGEDYEGYISKLLFLCPKKTLSYRTMDLMEQQLHRISGYEQVKMDQMLVAADVTFVYRAYPVFSKLVTVTTLADRPYTFSGVESFCYDDTDEK